MRVTTTIVSAAALVLLCAVPALTQRNSRDPQSVEDDFMDQCHDNQRRNDDDRVRFCEVRERRISAPRLLDVDGQQNGGVSVHGWNRSEVLVVAKIQSEGEDPGEARDLAAGINIETGSGHVHAEGPSTRRRQSWSVSYDVWVPQQTDLRLTTHNGGVSVEDVDGRVEMSAMNGGIHLRGVSGDVRGETTNGPLNVELDGAQWRGPGLDLRTTNGPVNLDVPDGYSAQLETGTVNGGIRIDFPITLQGGMVGRRITTQLGRGGAPIRAVTTNGPVTIRRR